MSCNPYHGHYEKKTTLLSMEILEYFQTVIGD